MARSARGRPSSRLAQMLTAIILIRANREGLVSLGPKLADVGGVAEVYTVTGDWDFVAIVRVREHDELASVVTQELARLDGLKAEAEKAKAAVDARVNGLDSEYRALQEAEDHIRAAIKKRDEELSAAFAAAGIALGGPPSAAGFINPTTGIITSPFGIRRM